MLRGMFTAASGMKSQQMMLDVISNNLSNANTTGFKKSHIDFQDLLYQTLRQAGSSSSSSTLYPTGIQLGHGSRPVAIRHQYDQGNLIATSSPLDLAIQGNGFFQITLPDGRIAYTRDGSFGRTSDGQLVNNDGYFLEPAITIPTNISSNDITISADGRVSYQDPNGTGSTEVGQIQIASFANPAGLQALGSNLFIETSASGNVNLGNPGEDGRGTLVQNFLESSNVAVVDEMVNMILAQRAYEVNVRSIQAADEMLQAANNLRRG